MTVTSMQSEKTPEQTSLAVIEPRIPSYKDQLHPVWEHMIGARTVCTWVKADRSAVIQLMNTGDQGITVPENICVGTIAIVTKQPIEYIGSLALQSPDFEEARKQLEPALHKAFADTTLTHNSEFMKLRTDPRDENGMRFRFGSGGSAEIN